MVLNVVVDLVSDGSVRVSWDRIDLPEITGYAIFYSRADNNVNVDVIEASVHVTNTTNSTVIENLMSGVEYQFQVAAIAKLDREARVGQRSTPNALTLPKGSQGKYIQLVIMTCNNEIALIGMLKPIHC